MHIEFFRSKRLLFMTNSKTQILMSTSAVLLIFVIEIVLLGFRKSSVANLLRNERSSHRDVLSYLLDVTGALRLMGHAVTLGSGYLIGQFIQQRLHLNLTGLLAQPAVQFSAFLFAKSFFDYWMHRLMHTFPVLWEIHKYHHSAAEMNVVTAHRESILVAPWSSLYFAIPLGIIGTPTSTVWLVGFLIEVHAVLVHSQLIVSWGKLGEYFLISPLAHRVHHSLDEKHWGKNYGFIFSFWDHVFGTYHLDEVRKPIVIGVRDVVYNHASWPHEMLYCLHSFALQVRNLIPFKRTV